ncbi:MAG: hypothetical protein AB1798_22070 [Spirochaetota bacterium]
MKELYKIAHECRNADSTRFWQMFAVMTAINAGLLAFVSAQKIDTALVPYCGALGAIVSLIWLGMQIRYLWWVKHWEGKLREFEPIVKEDITVQRNIEKLPPLPDNLALFNEKTKPRPSGLSTRRYSCIVALLFIGVWAIVALYSAWR